MSRLSWYVDMLLHDQHGMATFLLYVQFRTQVRGNVSRTPRSPRCSRKNKNTSASTDHAVTMTARDLHHSTHFEENNTRLHAHCLARLCRIPRTSRSITTWSLHALQSVIARGSFWNSQPGAVLGRTHRRAQDLSGCGDSPFSPFGKTPIGLLHVVKPRL